MSLRATIIREGKALNVQPLDRLTKYYKKV
jgi:hypothetical protein